MPKKNKTQTTLIYLIFLCRDSTVNNSIEFFLLGGPVGSTVLVEDYNEDDDKNTSDTNQNVQHYMVLAV